MVIWLQGKKQHGRKALWKESFAIHGIQELEKEGRSQGLEYTLPGNASSAVSVRSFS